jgi:hypothetical protein
MARTHRLVLVLPEAEWKALQQQAMREDRDPFQQARWLLRKALREPEPPAETEEEPERCEVAS